MFGESEPQRENPPRGLPEHRFGSKSMNAAFAAIIKRTSGYVGVEHFASAVRLLGYGGVALCLDEMLKIVRLNVSWCGGEKEGIGTDGAPVANHAHLLPNSWSKR